MRRFVRFGFLYLSNASNAKWLGAGLLSVAFGSAFLMAPVRPGVVLGDSMAPTFKSGEWFTADMSWYRTRPVERWDVVLLRHDGQTYLKRVLALPGDVVDVNVDLERHEDELVMGFNIERLRETQRNPVWSHTRRLVRRRIPPGYCYVVGDNPECSADSRTFGFVPLEAIQGRVVDPSPAPFFVRNAAGTYVTELGS